MKIKIYQINSERDALRVKFCGLQETQKIQRSNGKSMLLDSSLYDEVYDGEVDCLSVEDVFTRFNIDHPPFHRGHSLSISDIVELQSAPEIVGRIRYCSAPGFYESVNFTDHKAYADAVREAIENDRDFEEIQLAEATAPDVRPGFYFCDRVGFEYINFDPRHTQKPDDLLRVVALQPGKPAYEAEVADSLRNIQQAVRGKFEVTYPFEGNAVAISNRDARNENMPPNRTINGEAYAGTMFIVGDNGSEGFCSLTDEQVKQYLAEFKEPELFDSEDMDEESGIQMT